MRGLSEEALAGIAEREVQVIVNPVDVSGARGGEAGFGGLESDKVDLGFSLVDYDGSNLEVV